MPRYGSIAELIFGGGKIVDNYLKIWPIKIANTLIIIKKSRPTQPAFALSKRGTTMTVTTVSGAEAGTDKPGRITLQQRKAVEQTLAIQEEAGHYSASATRCPSPVSDLQHVQFPGQRDQGIVLCLSVAGTNSIVSCLCHRAAVCTETG